ncbi:TRAP transporter large permease [Chloroflexota bacterium]
MGLLMIGAPVYLALSIVGLGGIALLLGPDKAMVTMMNQPFPYLAKFTLALVPLFIMMGHFAFGAGISRNAYDIGRKWMSRFPASLGLATIVGCAGFAATCGSSVASAATMGTVAIPEMERFGYDRKFATGCVASGGLLGIMIPPSIPLVIYAIVTETSVGAQLVAGFLPGILTAVVFMIGIIFLVRRDPKLAPPAMGYTWKERIISLMSGWGIVLLFMVVIGGMYAGVFTPSEAASWGAIVALIMMIGTKKDIRKKFVSALSQTVRTTGMIFIIILAAWFYSLFLTLSGASHAISNWVMGLNVAPIVIIIIVLAIYLPLGMFLEPTSILVITLPIFHPIIVNQLGFNSIWFGILVVKMIEIGLITPPVGMNVFVIAGVAPHVPLEDIFKGILPFVLFEIVTTGLLIAFPIISLWLPQQMYISAG